MITLGVVHARSEIPETLSLLPPGRRRATAIQHALDTLSGSGNGR
jgi:hypothetical protein